MGHTFNILGHRRTKDKHQIVLVSRERLANALRHSRRMKISQSERVISDSCRESLETAAAPRDTLRIEAAAQLANVGFILGIFGIVVEAEQVHLVTPRKHLQLEERTDLVSLIRRVWQPVSQK